jgi:hypothetical protein
MLEQPNLPNFEKAEAEARERDIDVLDTIGRLSRFYVNMDKCKDPKVIPLCQKQKNALQYYLTAEYRKSKERS